MKAVLTAWDGPRAGVAASWVALVLAAAVALFSRGLDWAGSWRQALDWGTGTAVLVGPVVAGLACWTYARMRNAGFHHVASSEPRGFAAWVAPAAWLWWRASLVLLGSVALAACVVISYGVPAAPRSLWIAVEAVAVLAAHVALGAALGVATARTSAAPLAAVGAFLLCVISTWGVIPGFFDTGGATGSLVGEAFDVRVLVLSGLAAVGVAAGALWLATSVLARRPRAAAAATLALIVPGAGGYLAVGADDDRYELTGRPVRMTCAGTTARVCVAADTPRSLDAAARQMARLAPALTDLGLPLAPRYVQSVPGVQSPPGVGVLLFVNAEETTGNVSADTAARALASPADCPQFGSDRPDVEALAARNLLSRWILQRSGVGLGAASGDVARWADSRASEGWVRTTYPGLAACRLDGLAPPPELGVW